MLQAQMCGCISAHLGLPHKKNEAGVWWCTKKSAKSSKL